MNNPEAGSIGKSPSAVGSKKAAGLDEIDWHVEASRSGTPVLKIGGRYVHSRYDPLGEAERIAEKTHAQIAEQQADCLIVVGLGLGYLPQILCDRIDIPILLWDPFPMMTRQMPIDQGNWRAQISVVTDTRSFVSAIKNRGRKDINPYLLIHPGYEEFARFEARFIIWYLRNNLTTAPMLSIDDALISKRALDALGWLSCVATIEELEGSLDGQTAVLISPGPSGRMVQPFLLPYREKGVIFSAIQSLKSLSDEGLSVDFVVAPDPQDIYFSNRHLEGFTPRFSALLADTSVDPALIENWALQTFLFHLRSQHLHQVFWEDCRLPVLDEPFISVSETMLVLARQMGACRFILIGMDFSSASPLYPVRFQTHNLAGRPCWTNSHYFHAARYLNYLCARMHEEGCRIWRVCDGVHDGLPIQGTEVIAPQQIKGLLQDGPGFECPAPRVHHRADRYHRIKKLLEKVIAQSEKKRGGPPCARPRDIHFADFEEIDLKQRRQYCEETLHQMAFRRNLYQNS